MRSRNALSLVAAFVALLLIPVFSNHAQAADESAVELARDQILAGVDSFGHLGSVGKMVVFGEDSFSIANQSGADHRNPLVAGAFWEKGRVIALGNHGLLDNQNDDNPGDIAQFYRNGIDWLAGESVTADALLGTKVVLAHNGPSSEWFADEGFTNVTRIGERDANGVRRTYLSELPVSYDTELNPVLGEPAVLMGWNGSNVSDEDIKLIQDFVKAGGGLFNADYGIGYQWWWGKSMPEVPSNRILRDAGIAYNSNWPGNGQPYNRATGHMTATTAIDTIVNPTDYTVVDHQISIELLKRITEALPADHPLIQAVNAARAAAVYTLMPTPSNGISGAFEKTALTNESDYLASLAPQFVTKHRLAEELYGIVPDDAPRIAEATASIDTSVPRWHATGMYVAPGELVTVVVPQSLVGQGYKLRVNAHTDNISRRDSWERLPVVHRWFPIDSTEVQVANAFGGLLFVDLDKKPLNVGTVDVTIKNAVEAPYFDLDTHSDIEWNTSLRNRPAPFGVFVSESMMIAVPTRDIEAANLTEPTRLMTWWNDVVILQDDLTGQIRTHPELANTDVQISAGAAHSGYPYQAYDKHWGNMVDVGRLTTRGSWGDFHELGHNHQRGWWTFGGDGEVSVNIMSNISLEQMVSDVDATRGWGYSTDPARTLAMAIHDVAPGGTYSSKRNRWSFWFQLADGFGWDAYRNVFHQYEEDNRTNKALLPTNDAEEKSQWLVRFSTEVGRDMSSFMVDTWGLQVSDAALDAVAHLPSWMPGDVAPVTATTSQGGQVELDPAAAVTNTMAAPQITLAQPAGGTITETADGTWMYDPAPGNLATDTITFEVSSHGKVWGSETITVSNLELPEQPKANFLDVADGQYYSEAVEWAFANGITTGTTDTTFSPNAPVSRGQLATFLWRYARKPAAGGHNFSDVPEDAYFADPVGWLAESKITTGTTATTFSPNTPVTRGQMATFLWRYAGEPDWARSSFSDVPEGVYYDIAVGWMADNEITTGTTATTFSPSATLTRAQAVTFLWRMAEAR